MIGRAASHPMDSPVWLDCRFGTLLALYCYLLRILVFPSLYFPSLTTDVAFVPVLLSPYSPPRVLPLRFLHLNIPFVFAESKCTCCLADILRSIQRSP